MNAKRMTSVYEQERTFKELVQTVASLKQLMRGYNVGSKSKTLQQFGMVTDFRDIIMRAMSSHTFSVGSVERKMRDDLVKFKNGKPNIKDYQVQAIARTEVKNLKEVEKLIRWSSLGFSQVKHLTSETSIAKGTVGEKDFKFNGRIFSIKHLLSSEEDRIPLHPNCMCTYVLWG